MVMVRNEQPVSDSRQKLVEQLQPFCNQTLTDELIHTLVWTCSPFPAGSYEQCIEMIKKGLIECGGDVQVLEDKVHAELDLAMEEIRQEKIKSAADLTCRKI